MDYSTRSADTIESRASRLQRYAGAKLRQALSDLTESRLRIELPGGYRFECGPADADHRADWTIRKWNALLRIASSGALGFSEGYIHGEWETSHRASSPGAALMCTSGKDGSSRIARSLRSATSAAARERGST